MSLTNSCTFKGNLAAEPDTIFLEKERPGESDFITNFRIAVNEYRKNKDGQWETSDTLWIKVSTFGYLAEKLADRTLQKGQEVVVHGKLRLVKYNDKNGNPGMSLELRADDVVPGKLPKGKIQAEEGPEFGPEEATAHA